MSRSDLIDAFTCQKKSPEEEAQLIKPLAVFSITTQPTDAWRQSQSYKQSWALAVFLNFFNNEKSYFLHVLSS